MGFQATGGVDGRVGMKPFPQLKRRSIEGFWKPVGGFKAFKENRKFVPCCTSAALSEESDQRLWILEASFPTFSGL